MHQSRSATPGTGSSQCQKRSHQSDCATGLTAVNCEGRWYEFGLAGLCRVGGTRSRSTLEQCRRSQGSTRPPSESVRPTASRQAEGYSGTRSGTGKAGGCTQYGKVKFERIARVNADGKARLARRQILGLHGQSNRFAKVVPRLSVKSRHRIRFWNRCSRGRDARQSETISAVRRDVDW